MTAAMTFVDWLILGGYCIGILLFGTIFAKRASKNMQSFFLAGRSLPWWVIGFSAVGAYTCSGAAPGFTSLVYTGGLIGNWTWWLNYAIWMPIVAVIWAKLWRRMGIVTTAEFIALRYGSKPARIFRPSYAIYMAFGFSVMLNAYILGWLLTALCPIFGWPPLVVMGFASGLVLAYVIISGLFGAAYADVIQMGIFLVGNTILIFTAMSAAGGIGGMWTKIGSQMDHNTFAAYTSPVIPSGNFGILAVVSFAILGLFYAISPSGGEGYTAQLFMAAKSEFHAQTGQLFNAIMTLIVRMIPFIFLGLLARALLPGLKDPDIAWGMLVSKYSFMGLTGLLVAAELAAFMSTMDTQTNWGASYIVNDLCRPYMRNQPDRTFVRLGRLSTALIMVIAIFIALQVQDMIKFFCFVNGVAIAFMLPVAWLRFFWWRFNIYGELIALFVGLPLSSIIWWVKYKDVSLDAMPQGVFLLFSLGWVVILTTTLLTKPEPMEKLIQFYKRCRPPGFWGPVIKAAGLDIGRQRSDTIRDIIDCVLGAAACISSVVVMTSLFGGYYTVTAISGIIFLAGTTVFALRWAKRAKQPKPAQETDN